MKIRNLIFITFELIIGRFEPKFIFDFLKYSIQYDGIYDLMMLWYEEDSYNEKNIILLDVIRLIKEIKFYEKSY